MPSAPAVAAWPAPLAPALRPVPTSDTDFDAALAVRDDPVEQSRFTRYSRDTASAREVPDAQHSTQPTGDTPVLVARNHAATVSVPADQ